MALIKCPECKKKISDQANECPNCGRKITESDKELAIIQKKKTKRGRRFFLIAAIILVLAGIAGGVTYYFVQENNKRIEEQRKEEEKKKAEEEKERKELEEKKKKRQMKRDFQRATLNLFGSTDGLIEHLSNIAIKVSHTWSNCIWEEKDKETNKWTLKKNGKFKDFSTAVLDCIQDTVYSEKTAKKYSDFKDKLNDWKKLKSDDYVYNEYKSIADDIEEYTNCICSFYSLLSQPTGSYDDFTESINDVQNEISSLSESISLKQLNTLY